MKKMRKFLAVLMTFVMVMGFATTALADEADEYTITAPSTTHQYEIYQIFTGDLSGKVLSNIVWGTNGKGTTNETVSEEVLTALEGVDGKTDAEKLAVILEYADLTTEPVATITNGETTEVPAGYYLIKDKDGSVSGNDAYTTYIVKIVGDVTISTKSDVPTVDKEILDPDETKVNEASIGEKVNYQITGTLPTNIEDYNTYYYEFTDTLSKGLTYNEDIKVYVNGVDVTNYFYINATDYDENNGTTITVAIQDLLALELLVKTVEGEEVKVVGDITASTEIVIIYSATLNENAVIAGEGNPNDVKLTYSNNPNDSGEGETTPPPEEPEKPTRPEPVGETPKFEVVTYVTELTIKKTDENGDVLTGAEFTLTTEDGAKIVLVTEEKYVEDEDGTYYELTDGTYTTEVPTEETKDYYVDTNVKYTKTTVVVAKGEGKTETTIVGTVDENGLLTFTGLGVGTYTITETKTPDGYNTIDPITFTISFNRETKKFSTDNDDITVEEDNTLFTAIVNQSGATLPETGGIGTTIFYVVGAILVIGAAVVMITRKRMEA